MLSNKITRTSVILSAQQTNTLTFANSTDSDETTSAIDGNALLIPTDILLLVIRTVSYTEAIFCRISAPSSSSAILQTVPRRYPSCTYKGFSFNHYVRFITKTCLYNFDSPTRKPHFCIVKLGFTGDIHYLCYFCSKTGIVYSIELPRRGGSNEHPQSMFCAEILKISEFLSENFQFW